MEFWKNIPSISQSLLLLWLVLTVFLAYSQIQKKQLIGVQLFGVSLVFGLVWVFVTPYLLPWDEQYHALVAKNLTQDWLHPQLMKFSPWLFEGREWNAHTTWLHKPPLFLYQMALSIKIFGANIFAVRLPSVLLYSVFVWSVYRVVSVWRNPNFGFWVSLLLGHSLLPLLLMTGNKETDHNDLVFMCYVGLSFCAHFHYVKDKSLRWAYLTGVLVACAVLTKWLPGLLVYAPWGMVALSNWIKKGDKTEFVHLMKSFGLTTILVAPWYLYIHFRFPDRAGEEMRYSTEHFSNALEGHSEKWYYHFQTLSEYFANGYLLMFFLILLVLALIKTKGGDRIVRTLLFSGLFLYLFYTMAATKMYSFGAPVLALWVILFLWAITEVGTWIKISRIGKGITAVGIGCLFWAVFQPTNLLQLMGVLDNTDEKEKKEVFTEQLQFIVDNRNDDSNRLIINGYMRLHGHIEWMFFSKNKAISFLPSENVLDRLKNEGYQITCVDWNVELPDYIINDPDIEIIQYPSNRN